MDMLKPSCEDVTAQLEEALRTGAFERVNAPAAAHISACPRCWAGLALLVSTAANPKSDLDECDGCQADLAMFMEQERLDPARAMGNYPQVWRHLWGCPDCLDDYLTAAEWLQAEQAGEITPLQAPVGRPLKRAISASRRIVLPRSVLALAIPAPQIALSPLRGFGGDGFVLFEDQEGGTQAHLTVMVRDGGNGTWQMVVTTKPPVVGMLRLTAGDTKLTAPFLSDGSATINAIPFSLLSDHEAPDVELIVLPVRDAAGR